MAIKQANRPKTELTLSLDGLYPRWGQLPDQLIIEVNSVELPHFLTDEHIKMLKEQDFTSMEIDSAMEAMYDSLQTMSLAKLLKSRIKDQHRK